jgi:hypothetical protein
MALVSGAPSVRDESADGLELRTDGSRGLTLEIVCSLTASVMDAVVLIVRWGVSLQRIDRTKDASSVNFLYILDESFSKAA